MCCNFAFAHGLRELAYFREKFCLEAADQRNIRSRLHAELLNARLGMKDLVTPLCRGLADLIVEKGIFRRKPPRKRSSLVSSNAFPSDCCLPHETVHFTSFPTAIRLSTANLFRKRNSSTLSFVRRWRSR